MLKVQGYVPSCEHQTDTLSSVRDFRKQIKQVQTKKNCTNSHTLNFNFLKSSTVSSNLAQVGLSLIYLSEINDHQDGVNNAKHQQSHTLSTAVLSTVEESYFLCLI